MKTSAINISRKHLSKSKSLNDSPLPWKTRENLSVNLILVNLRYLFERSQWSAPHRVCTLTNRNLMRFFK